MPVTSTTHTVDLSPGLPFCVLGNRYQTDLPRAEGYTLILLHATGLHKETFEPLIHALFETSQAATNTVGPKAGASIREIWTIDCPNHGESAVLNHDVLGRDYADNWDGYFFARSVHAFLTSKPGGVNLQHHKLIVGGHSFGGNAAILLPSMAPRIEVASIILLDATIGGASKERDHTDVVVTQIVWSKADVWRSRDDALRKLSAAPGFRTWDPRVLQVFVKHALTAHPASRYPPPFRFDGVTLACTKSYEMSCHRAKNHHEECVSRLHDAYAKGPPVHLINSLQDEFDGGKLKEAMLTDRRGGGPASVQWMENATHMFVQQRPQATADAVWRTMRDMGNGTSDPRL